jgi:hypothetical protein
MHRRLFAFAILGLAALAAEPSFAPGQDVKSGPQIDEVMPGAIQALNVTGPFAGRYHCLVCEYRLYPVALVFVKARPEGVSPEVKKLLEALDAAAVEHHDNTGMEAFVVFLTPAARSGATVDKIENPEDAIPETAKREKLVIELGELGKSFKRLVVTTMPAENIKDKYKLDPRAEVTVVLYARHRVYNNFAFGEDQLNAAGRERVLQGVIALLDRLRTGPADAKGAEKDKDKGK